jgi:hypothetical protein
MTLPPHPDPAPTSDQLYFGFWGGRVMAMLVVAMLSWYSLVDSRDEAQSNLTSFTPEVHAAAYDSAYARMKTTAQESDGFLVAVAIFIGAAFLLYEALATVFSWGLARLNGEPFRFKGGSRG